VDSLRDDWAQGFLDLVATIQDGSKRAADSENGLCELVGIPVS
jgi:hypothetical protein